MRNRIEGVITNIDDKFIDETITHMNKRVPQRKDVLTAVKKLGVCVAAVLLLLFGGVSAAVAAGNIQAYEIVYSLYPDMAKRLVPIHESCVDKGIKMSVEAIHIDGNTASIYLSLQDIEGSLIDESVDLFDSYSIHTNVAQIGGCTLVSYDEVNKLATFLVTVQQEESIAGKYMSFSVSKILTGKEELTLKLPQILLAEETDNIMSLRDVKLRGSGGVGDVNINSILISNKDQYYSPTQGAAITAYGFIDGKLHVQVYYEDILRYDNHGTIYLEKNDEIVYPARSYSFWDEEQRGSFDEYIFDIAFEEIQNYDIIGNFVTSQTLIEGNWNVSFPIENM